MRENYCFYHYALNLKWESVHLNDRFIYLSDLKGGESARPLNQKVIDLLASMERKKGNPYVFYGKIPGMPIQETKSAWRVILKRAKIEEFRIHDLRHSYASFALKKRVNL